MFSGFNPATNPALAGAPAGVAQYGAAGGPPGGNPMAQMGVSQSQLNNLSANTGATTPVFVNEEERKKSITLTGRRVNVVSRDVTTQTSTNLTIVGLETGATFNISITVNPNPTS